MWFRSQDRLRNRRRRSTRRLLLEDLESRRVMTFVPAVDYSVGSRPAAIVSGDFNNDGRLDLATTGSDASVISVLLGNGAGGFGTAIDSYVDVRGTDRVCLTVADFDNDGDDDLAAAIFNPDTGAYGAGVRLFLSNGNGTFTAANDVSTASYTLAVASGDFNNDGNADLVVSGDNGGYAGFGAGFVQVLLGNGRGAFTQMTPSWQYNSAWNTELAVGDLNGDGNLDAAIALGEFGPGGYVLLGDGSGGLLLKQEFFTSYMTKGIAIGDLSGDGISDLMVGVYDSAYVESFVNRGDGTFGASIPNGAQAPGLQTGFVAADFNGDGRLDVITSTRSNVSETTAGTVTELSGNGDGSLTYFAQYTVGQVPLAITVGDFNGDGRPDVATANAGSTTVSVLLNSGTWTPPPPPPPPPPQLYISDAPTVTEGYTGTRPVTFTVMLSAASTKTVTVAYATSNGNAVAGSDYQATNGTLTFAPGETSKTITVQIIGDRLGESFENFFVNLSSPTNAVISGSEGIGTIIDDDPRISINDVTLKEGAANKTTTFTFTISLSAAATTNVTVNYATANGTATAGTDYVSKSGTVTFLPGEKSKQITVSVNGDKTKEANETFFVNLSSANGGIADAQGLGTILDDDSTGGGGKGASVLAIDAAIDDMLSTTSKKRKA